MRRSSAAFFLGVLCLVGCGRSTSALSAAPHPRHDTEASGIDVTAAQNWLAQKVCVDGSNTPVAVDPYNANDPFGNGCSGYAERNLQGTDSVPYYRYATDGKATSPNNYWYGYAFPVTGASGEQMFVMDRELTPWSPPDHWYVNPTYYPAHTHWDLYRIQNGWISNAATRDGSGFNQTFFGNDSGTATPYNGWIDFPLSFLGALSTSAAFTNVPVHDVYWEQSGLPWPLPPQIPPTSMGTQTTWKMIAGYTFASGKTMNALVVYHQSKPPGSMEVWYFTIPYGPSRWETWSIGTSSSSLQRCGSVAVSQTFPYGTTSYQYSRTNCVDWTRSMLATAGSTVPLAPIPETNVLANMHFSNDPPSTSGGLTGWTVGTGLSLSQQTTTSPADSNGHAGARYVRVACLSSCTGDSAFWQDVAVSASAVYAFGVDARTESGTGQLQVSLVQIDASGNVLPQSGAAVTAVIASSNDRSCGSSIVLCSAYTGQRTAITLQQGAVALREIVRPLTPGVAYDVTDAYVAAQ